MSFRSEDICLLAKLITDAFFYLNNIIIITNKSRNMILISLFINSIIKPPPLEVNPKPLKGKASAKYVKF